MVAQMHAQVTPAGSSTPTQSAWWRGWRVVLPVAGLVLFVLIIIGGYAWNWKWTGFSDNTLWDWLQLLVLPVVLSLGGIWLNMHQNRISRALAEQQHAADLQIADDNQQEAALQAYLDHLSQLLLEKQLKEAPPGSPIRELAHARTLATVWHIGRHRKGTVLRFLRQANLIGSGSAVVNLEGADLTGAHLRGIDLRQTDLTGADLRQADLHGARLSQAHLRNANLAGADLSEANLTAADLTGADLTGALLEGTNLEGAILAGARLSGTLLDPAGTPATTSDGQSDTLTRDTARPQVAR